MPLVANQNLIAAEMKWSYEADNTGFSDATQADDLNFRMLPDSTELFAFQYTINPAATQAVDLYTAFTNLVKESVFAVAVRGGWIEVTGSGGILKMEPHGTNPLNWPIAAGGYETITPGTGGAGDVWSDGQDTSVTPTSRAWLLTNTGAAQITVRIVVFVDGATYMLDFSKAHNSGYLAIL